MTRIWVHELAIFPASGVFIAYDIQGFHVTLGGLGCGPKKCEFPIKATSRKD